MDDTDLGKIIDTIVAFNFNDYVLGPDSYLELSPLYPDGNVREWVIDLAIEIAEALEPGVMHSASIAGVPEGDSAAAAMSHMHEQFVHGIQESHRTSGSATAAFAKAYVQGNYGPAADLESE